MRQSSLKEIFEITEALLKKDDCISPRLCLYDQNTELLQPFDQELYLIEKKKVKALLGYVHRLYLLPIQKAQNML